MSRWTIELASFAYGMAFSSGFAFGQLRANEVFRRRLISLEATLLEIVIDYNYWKDHECLPSLVAYSSLDGVHNEALFLSRVGAATSP